MLVRTSIIAQAIDSQGNNKFFRRTYASELCRFAQSVIAIVDDFSHHALAACRDHGLGLVPAWVRRDHPLGAPDRPVGRHGCQPVIDTLHRATDLGLVVWDLKEPFYISRECHAPCAFRRSGCADIEAGEGVAPQTIVHCGWDGPNALVLPPSPVRGGSR
jgi:hypothetical protein